MSIPRLLSSALVLWCAVGLDARPGAAQPPASHAGPPLVAASVPGAIHGLVLAQDGRPLDGAVVSALGGAPAFAVTGADGRFSLADLPPGPYLLRVHLEGFLPARPTLVEVRPAGRSESTFRLHRAGTAAEPRLAAAGVAGVADAPGDEARADGRDESETAWRLRRLKRSVLKDSGPSMLEAAGGSAFTEPFEILGRAVEQSARAATAFFTDLALEGEVNLVTTGAFHTPGQIFGNDRMRRVAFFSVGSEVGAHGDWSVRAALNQSDLSAWSLAGSYYVAKPTRTYEVGLSYAAHRYEGGNPAALAALADGTRNVGSVFGFAEVRLARALQVGYGARYAHYDYLGQASLFSPRVSVTVSPTPNTRVRAAASRQQRAPGAEEFQTPTSAYWLPPQRTFSPLSTAGFRIEDVQQYEVALERLFNGVTVGVRAFHEFVDDQAVTVFGLHTSDAARADVGHYLVGTVGDVAVRGFGVTVSHQLAPNLRGAVDYSTAAADWTRTAPRTDLAVMAAWLPSALREDGERLHDVTTSLETEIARSATRLFVLYKFNNAFVRRAPDELDPGFAYRFDVQVHQGLPFLNFRRSEWEMLVAVRNMFYETMEGSSYDELMVLRPPKRVVGGITVKF